MSAASLANAVRAETLAEYANPPVAPPALNGPHAQPASQPLHLPQPSQRPPVKSRPPTAMFAPAAAAHAKRLSAQQREERRFLKDAAASSRFEEEAARLALGKSNDPDVRSLAAMLIDHHAAAGNDLLHMLHARGMAAPMLANDQRKVLNRLARLQGARFDRDFLEEVGLRYQQQDVDRYERASLDAGEPRLKAWIARSLPTLRDHVTRAERMSPATLKFSRSPAAPFSGAAANRFVSRARRAGAHGRDSAGRRAPYRVEYPVTRHFPSVSCTVVTTSWSSRLSNLVRKMVVTYSPSGRPASLVL
jgi:predicted outer membrane protein